MRTIPILLLACLTGGSALVASAHAQQSAPPGLQPLEEPIALPSSSPGSATARSQLAASEDKQKPPLPHAATETRLPGGRVTEIEVRSGASIYYLHPQTATGGAPRDTGRDGGRTAQWNVFNFNTPRSDRNATQRAPVPPPPRAD